MRPLRIAPLLAAGALLLAACGGGSGNDAASVPEASAAPSASVDAMPDSTPPDAPAPAPASEQTAGDDSAAAAAPEALQFSAPLVGGGEIDARTLAGKPTVFWFWAPT